MMNALVKKGKDVVLEKLLEGRDRDIDGKEEEEIQELAAAELEASSDVLMDPTKSKARTQPTRKTKGKTKAKDDKLGDDVDVPKKSKARASTKKAVASSSKVSKTSAQPIEIDETSDAPGVAKTAGGAVIIDFQGLAPAGTSAEPIDVEDDGKASLANKDDGDGVVDLEGQASAGTSAEPIQVDDTGDAHVANTQGTREVAGLEGQSQAGAKGKGKPLAKNVAAGDMMVDSEGKQPADSNVSGEESKKTMAKKVASHDLVADSEGKRKRRAKRKAKVVISDDEAVDAGEKAQEDASQRSPPSKKAKKRAEKRQARRAMEREVDEGAELWRTMMRAADRFSLLSASAGMRFSFILHGRHLTSTRQLTLLQMVLPRRRPHLWNVPRAR